MKKRVDDFIALAVCLGAAAFLCGCASVLPNPLFPRSAWSIPHADTPESGKQLDIPRYTDGEHDGQPFFYYTTAKQREKQLGLSAPELSDDETLLRIWWTIQSGLRQPGRLLEFVKNDGQWSGRVFDYKMAFDTWKFHENVYDVKRREFVPASDWDTLDRLLAEYEIPALPACDFVEDYDRSLAEICKENPHTILSTFSVEYATPEIYRFYEYTSPGLIRGKIREAELFSAFLEKIGEFDKILTPYIQ